MGEIIESFGKLIISIITVAVVIALFLTFWNRADVTVVDGKVIVGNGSIFSQKILQAVHDNTEGDQNFKNNTADINVDNYNQYDLYIKGVKNITTNVAYDESELLNVEAYKVDPTTKERVLLTAEGEKAAVDTQVIGVYDTYNNPLIASTTNTSSDNRNYENCILCGSAADSAGNAVDSAVTGKYPVHFNSFHGYSRVPITDSNGKIIDYKVSHLEYERKYDGTGFTGGKFTFFTPGDYVLKVQSIDPNGKASNVFVRLAVNIKSSFTGPYSSADINVSNPSVYKSDADVFGVTITINNVTPSTYVSRIFICSDTADSGELIDPGKYAFDSFNRDYGSGDASSYYYNSTLKLKPEFMQGLSVGTYYIRIVLSSGESVMSEVTVK